MKNSDDEKSDEQYLAHLDRFPDFLSAIDDPIIMSKSLQRFSDHVHTSRAPLSKLLHAFNAVFDLVDLK